MIIVSINITITSRRLLDAEWLIYILIIKLLQYNLQSIKYVIRKSMDLYLRADIILISFWNNGHYLLFLKQFPKTWKVGRDRIIVRRFPNQTTQSGGRFSYGLIVFVIVLYWVSVRPMMQVPIMLCHSVSKYPIMSCLKAVLNADVMTCHCHPCHVLYCTLL